MKLYGHPLSSCTRKVLCTLAEKSATAELVTIDLLAGEHHQPAYLAHHPFGVIPVLDDGGWKLYESRAIIRYLDATRPGPRLVPSAPREVARMDQWLSVDASYIAPHTRTLANQRIVRPHRGLAPEPAPIAEAEAALVRAFAVIDRALADTRHLAGDAFTLADISLAPYVAGLAMVGAEHVAADRPHLARWWAAVSERPSWRRAVGLA
jgi:glutathione S-transferase